MSIRHWTTLLAALVLGLAHAQVWQPRLAVEAAGVRPLHADVVSASAKDHGARFGGYEIGGGLELSRPLNEWASLFADIGYRYGQHGFELPCNCAHPHDRVIVIENDLRLHGGTVSLGFEARTRNEQYGFLSVRIGGEAILHAERDIQASVHYLGNRPDTSVVLETDEDHEVRSGLGVFIPQIEVGIGVQLWRWQPLRVEFVLRNDLNEQAYGLVSSQGTYREVQLRRTSFALRLAFPLGSTGRTKNSSGS